MILFELLSPSKSATLASRKAHPAAAADLSSAVHLFLSPCLREGKKGGRGQGKDASWRKNRICCGKQPEITWA